MTGRPSDFTQATADIICARLADGESLRAICASDDMPSKTSVFRWLAVNEAFRDQYARAREAQADHLVDEILEISDDATNDWMVRNGKDGEDSTYVLNGEHVQRSRLRVDSRKWFASKVAPKKYGEKLELAGDKENPLAVTISGLRATLGAKLDRIPNAGPTPKPED